ncbi:hypothetical protein [Paenibacillus mendelii]|uniref:Glycosyl hydrolase family 32 N-terminal domain-containing protein n=1 Tax=Paenibacillus mendelii TaxID=206163 RepID=A0ABV6J3M6_9BACL|nr:hypothetical protein [Paenibacillus mendelii]MCQ6559246.1 hypothetical protein [Paenibacillus mendelii]
MSSDMYRLEDKYVWDFWYARKGDEYHAYYLQYPREGDPEHIHSRQSVGHAISRDLLHWDEQPAALQPLPETWNDKGIATGSVIFKDDGWYMLFTGNSNRDEGGIGLALSQDLMNWSKVGDAPVIPKPCSFTAKWDGEAIVASPLADPFVYPEMIDGWHYMVINSHAVQAPEGSRGCQLMLRSRNLTDWEAHTIAAYPKRFERMETSQIWTHDGRWYMYFGGVTSDNTFENWIYVADRFDGPYEAKPWSRITLPDVSYFYIAKVIQDVNGEDIFLANSAIESLLRGYRIVYGEEGSITLEGR